MPRAHLRRDAADQGAAIAMMFGVQCLMPSRALVAAALPDDERYRYFVSNTALGVWPWGLLGPHGWVSLTDPEGRVGLLLWSHPEDALACAVGEHAGCLPACIDVRDFTGRWLSDMAELQVGLHVFPTPSCSGVAVSARQLELDLHAASSRSAYSLPRTTRRASFILSGHS